MKKFIRMMIGTLLAALMLLSCKQSVITRVIEPEDPDPEVVNKGKELLTKLSKYLEMRD